MKQQKKPQETSPKKGSKSLKDRIHKHLTDKNDIITDEDLKNIKVGADQMDEEPKSAQELEKAIEEKKITSPWNILSEEDK